MKKYVRWSVRVASAAAVAMLATFSVTASAQQTASEYTFPVAPVESIEMPNGDVVHVYKGTVQHVSGNRLTIRFPHGEHHTYTVPSDYRFDVDGRKVRTRDLQRGDELSAYVTAHPVRGHEIHEVDTTGDEIVIVDSITPEPVADSLPSTASFMPLIGLLGTISLALGALGFGLRRRFSA